jgi:hypothetical protein
MARDPAAKGRVMALPRLPCPWASSAAMAGATIFGGTITAKPTSVGTTRCGMAMASRTKVQDSACPRSGEGAHNGFGRDFGCHRHS